MVLLPRLDAPPYLFQGNIAEGFGRKHTKDKLNFYYDARGSLCETKNHLIYGHQVGYFADSEFDENNALIKDIWRELNSLMVTLEASSEPRSESTSKP
ncbi:MAG: four helix bundle protein [Candidatus Edwardsbacteria bacterium]